MKKSFYPLIHFNSYLNNTVQLIDGISIVSNNIDTNLIEPIDLSSYDIQNIQHCNYCLCVDDDIIQPNLASVYFILACRLLKRSKVTIRYHIDSNNRIKHIRDDYPFIPAHDSTSSISESEIIVISKLLSGIIKFEPLNIRTSNSLYFIKQAYSSRIWLDSLLFMVCSLETLISAPDRESYIKALFRDRINGFTNCNKYLLMRIYDVRSELIHGRYNYKSDKVNLRFLRIADTIVRKVFSKILLDESIIIGFTDDITRLNLFNLN